MSTIRPRPLEELSRGYDAAHRRLEIAGITAFFVCQAVVLTRLLDSWHGLHIVAAAAIAGYFAADFISGFVHWLGDTWGDPDLPVLGRNFIRPFRHHHVDPLAITRHDFVATNGNNCITTLALLVPIAFVPVSEDQTARAFALWFSLWLTLTVFLTNQFHKWAHLPAPPRPVVWLQRAGLILSPAHHEQHHGAPYDRNYCITAGWLDGPLARAGFFRRLERAITALTGILPRRDDIGEAAAAVLVNGVVADHAPDPADRR